MDQQGHLNHEWNVADETGRGTAEPSAQEKNIERISSKVNIAPFVGRLGGNGSVPTGSNAEEEKLLDSIPDAAPLMTTGQVFDMRPFRTVGLWKAASIEGMGKYPHSNGASKP